jgi:2,5-diketo-D-gluconate reductase B
MLFVDLLGAPMPSIGLGTWELRGGEGERAIARGLELGYRHIDTAESYGNEEAVGAAIAAAGVPRQQLFLVTKLTSTSHGLSGPKPALARSLERLRTDYVDLLLIHWPSPNVGVGDTLGAMMDLQSQGLVRRIGVSNFTVALMREAVETGAPIACNQVEYHLGLSQRRVLDYARAHHIAVTAYSPLIKGDLAKSPVLAGIGAKYGKTPGQIALRWLIEQPGVGAIPKAASLANQKLNLDLFDFALDPQDKAALDSFGPTRRMISPAHAPAWDPE